MADLRIIADDLGLAGSVNEGIILALKNRWIYGASLMPNGEAFSDALARLQEVPEANLGVHIVLVEERALGSYIPPKDHRVFFIKYILGLIKLTDIEKETRLQIEKCIAHGVRPRFINSHQHLHLLPGITDIFIKLAKEYGIPYIRIVSEPFFGSGGSIFRKVQSLVLRCLSSIAARSIDRNGLQRNDIFIGFGNAGNFSGRELELAKKIGHLQPHKMIELGCHPGFEDQHLEDTYRHWGGYHWRQELAALEKAHL